jgi:uncharacterized membrane protein YtjA (UPF0391 family)
VKGQPEREGAGGRCNIKSGSHAACGVNTMLKWALIFAVIALIAGVFGFAGVAGAAADIAKILFFLFLAIVAFFVIAGVFVGKKISGG